MKIDVLKLKETAQKVIDQKILSQEQKSIINKELEEAALKNKQLQDKIEADKIIENIPAILEAAASIGEFAAKVYSIPKDGSGLSSSGFTCDLNANKLNGVAKLVYDFCLEQSLNPFIKYTSFCESIDPDGMDYYSFRYYICVNWEK